VTAFLGLLIIWFHGPFVIWGLVLTRVGCALLAVATLLILRALVPRILKIPSRVQWLALNKGLMRAEARAEAREKLLATVSHELRTPLAPLLASLTELEHRVRPYADPEIEDCIELMRKNILKEALLVNDLIYRLDTPGSEPAILPEPDGDVRPRRLLLVEDHVDTLRTFAKVLRREGYEVQEATTVSEAIAAARTGDFLVSDIALPDGDGCGLMRHLSALGIPGIAISGFGTARDREQYKRAGFAESLIKPVDVRQVISAISRVMSGDNGTPTRANKATATSV
jgi:CheY-like chemotaxis protein